MSAKEINRVNILQQVQGKQLTQIAAAKILRISDRQLRRLIIRYRNNGAAGITHGSRGSPSNHQLPDSLKEKAINLVKTKYLDFGPTFASEKLAELNNVIIGHETLRLLMIEAGIWQPKKRRTVHRTRRERRPCYGEMEQFDGCRHDWFEGRLAGGAWATLLASRDDADNTVRAKFVAYEGTAPVMEYWRDYFKLYGKPQSIYLDRHSTYKVNSKTAIDDDSMLSQFERAMKQLNVNIIHANSPQAKGRIENLFGTFQDRLPKELRLANISDIETANEFLQNTFLPNYNKRFCVTPSSTANVHSPLLASEKRNLDAIFSIQSERYIGQDFTIRFHSQWLQLNKIQPTLVLPRQKVVIEERLDSSTRINLNGKYLNYIALDSRPIITTTKLPIALTSNPKTDNTHQKPAYNHPWRNYQANRIKTLIAHS